MKSYKQFSPVGTVVMDYETGSMYEVAESYGCGNCGFPGSRKCGDSSHCGGKNRQDGKYISYHELKIKGTKWPHLHIHKYSPWYIPPRHPSTPWAGRVERLCLKCGKYQTAEINELDTITRNRLIGVEYGTENK